ncbi:MAG: EAL domain-containing protein [Proteobacteria bacterium]|nr:EAL domain-containing protein [Pseudomonadota bacterium]HQR04689.1 EAL domain-containing protein [Rhodocyclaceae bacterium]
MTTTETTTDQPAPPDVFIGRQPILDKDHTLIGYELLFRDSRVDQANFTSNTSATADVVCKAFAELGLASALGNQRAFINTDEHFLADDAIELLPRETVVLEIDLDHITNKDLEERCRILRELGYQICISGITTLPDPLPPVFEYAAYAKVDANQPDNNGSDILAIVGQRLKSHAIRLIASRVESFEQMQHCAHAGFDYFQGYYFARPTIVEGRKLGTATHQIINLINLLTSDADTSLIEAAFKREPALSVNLLRLTNSVGIGATVHVTSIHHAITLLGRRQLLRWMQLLLFSQNNALHAHPNPLMQLAALKGYFMELVAGRMYPTRKEMRELAFLTGIMSLVPIVLGASLESILEQISTAPEVRNALLGQEDGLGLILRLTEFYDAGDMENTQALLKRIDPPMRLQSLGLCLTEAIGWVQNIGEA